MDSWRGITILGRRNAADPDVPVGPALALPSALVTQASQLVARPACDWRRRNGAISNSAVDGGGVGGGHEGAGARAQRWLGGARPRGVPGLARARVSGDA